MNEPPGLNTEMRFSLDFPHAYGTPSIAASFRETPEDFLVDEELDFEPAGEGEHVYLHIRKRGENTDWLAGRIARFAGTEKKDVSFAGLKDRHAITSQWFSVYLPKGPEPDWREFAAHSGADIKLLNAARHTRKLRRGEHARNRFCIRLHFASDQAAVADIEPKLEQIKTSGVPNYFGEQRFGREANNLVLAADWLEHGKRLKDRRLRGMVMSAARSWLFNQVLSNRISQGAWPRAIEGDVTDETGSPTGPLWGRGRSQATGPAAEAESAALAPWAQWRDGLEHCGLNQERRPLVSYPQTMDWQIESGILTLRFGLAPGQFATAVLREIAALTEAPRDY